MEAQYWKGNTAAAAASLVAACALVGCQGDPIAAPRATITAHVAQFTEWSAPVNIGPPVNAAGVADNAPTLSRDGLSLYLARGGLGTTDIWVAQRGSPDDPWTSAQDLGSVVNSPAADAAPALSADGHRLFFNSTRPGGFGGQDLYVARRRDTRDDFGWRAPVNLGSAVNTGADETQAVLFEDDATGVVTLYFAANRPGGPGGVDIYASTLLPDETYGPPVLVAELSSAGNDRPNEIRHDGLELFVASSRPGTLGGEDLWVAARASTSDPWSTPVNLGPVVNTTFNEAGAGLSHDATTLFFHSNANRPGATGPCFGTLGPCFFDIYVTTRSKLRVPD